MKTYNLNLEKGLRERLERILKRHMVKEKTRNKILYEMYGPERIEGDEEE